MDTCAGSSLYEFPDIIYPQLHALAGDAVNQVEADIFKTGRAGPFQTAEKPILNHVSAPKYLAWNRERLNSVLSPPSIDSRRQIFLQFKLIYCGRICLDEIFRIFFLRQRIFCRIYHFLQIWRYSSRDGVPPPKYNGIRSTLD